MTLYIDTTEFKKITFVLAGKKRVGKTYKLDPRRSFTILPKLEDFLKLSKIKTEDIKKIYVNKGPGSFTGIRVGAAHALALSLAWGVPLKFYH